MHKKVLKDEVLRLRKELNESEIRASNKTVALKSLADFFNNQTLAKVRQMNPDLLSTASSSSYGVLDSNQE